MLKHLRITNFAILSDVELEFHPGFNVLTGETGAGKSLIVDAVALLRGGRASSDIPRAGADEAVVEAVFVAPPDLASRVAERLEDAGLPPGEDGEVLVRRVITVASGKGSRSRIHVNGGLTTAHVLAELGSLLVELAGQHEHQGLVDPGRHADLLDRFGVPDEVRARMVAAAERLRGATAALEGGADGERARAERQEFLRYQLDEIDAAAVQLGEEDDLAAERDRLRSAGRLSQAARRGEDELYAREGAVVDVLGGIAVELEPLVGIDPRLGGALSSIEQARMLAEEAAQTLRRYADAVHDDPERLEAVEDRLHVLARLFRKHGVASANVLRRRAELASELAELEARSTSRDQLERDLAAARVSAEQAAEALSAARRQAASKLERSVAAALGELGMEGARLKVSFEPRKLGPGGAEAVELLLASNEGEEPKALQRIASGGELSRIMLALKLCLRHADTVGTYVFDEVDAGLGGQAAHVVGKQLRRVADGRQVIAVTHLPQIAALADAHFQVEKYVEDGRTETSVTRLAQGERKGEIARMLGGDEMLTFLGARGRKRAKS
jgi:DNA repair protein RecN (Recombination protein N)